MLQGYGCAATLVALVFAGCVQPSQEGTTRWDRPCAMDLGGQTVPCGPVVAVLDLPSHVPDGWRCVAQSATRGNGGVDWHVDARGRLGLLLTTRPGEGLGTVQVATGAGNRTYAVHLNDVGFLATELPAEDWMQLRTRVYAFDVALDPPGLPVEATVVPHFTGDPAAPWYTLHVQGEKGELVNSLMASRDRIVSRLDLLLDEGNVTVRTQMLSAIAVSDVMPQWSPLDLVLPQEHC